MWSKPWSYKEGLTIGAGLLIIGILLQGRRIIFFTILQLVFYFYIIDY